VWAHAEQSIQFFIGSAFAPKFLDGLETAKVLNCNVVQKFPVFPIVEVMGGGEPTCLS